MRGRSSLAVRLALAGTLVAIVACGSPSSSPTTPSGSDATSTAAAFARRPSVEITYPVSGEPVAAGDVLVALTVRSFEIASLTGRVPKDGEGHIVYYLDVDPIPMGTSDPLAASGRGRADASRATSHTWKGVAPGPHIVGVQLVGNDGRPLTPPATDHLTVTVR